MSLGSHLKELRSRLLRSVAALGLSTVTAFYFSDRLLSWLRQPLSAPLVFITPAEVLVTDIKISLFFGLAIALPFLLYELWQFISPGLIEKEQHSVYPFLFFSSLSFYIGVAFSYLFTLPLALQFLISYGQSKGIVSQISLASYVDFNLTFLFSFGLIFEVPIMMVLLAKTGLLTVPFLTHYRKYAIVAAFIVAAILTPTPDIFNQMMMAIPLILLYEIGIIAVRITGRSKAVA